MESPKEIVLEDSEAVIVWETWLAAKGSTVLARAV
jgi:hypothetical protein